MATTLFTYYKPKNLPHITENFNIRYVYCKKLIYKPKAESYIHYIINK